MIVEGDNEIRFEGSYPTWQDANAQCNGYTSKEILEKITSCSELISLSLNLKLRSFFINFNLSIPSSLFRPKLSNILFCYSSISL